LEIAHVLFMDIVGYSKLPMEEQRRYVQLLQEIVPGTPEFVRALAADELLKIPTGDGMALVFFGDPEAAPRCALEVAGELKKNTEIKLRMGLHSGPVFRGSDINATSNVSGGGINFAQRVMDCGDAGHILVSSTVAEVLKQLSQWADRLHDLGEAEVKHGARIHIFNLYTDEVGCRETPQKLRAAALDAGRSQRRRKAVLWIGAFAGVLLFSLLLRYFFSRPAAGPSMARAPLTGSPGFEEEPSFSPDGSEIVYTWDGGKAGTRSIYLKRVGAGIPLPLTTESDGDVQSPAWSADRMLIFYVRPVGDKAEIRAVPSLRGPGRSKLGETFLYPSNLNRHPGLSASPEGRYLAVPNRGAPGTPPGIFLLSLETRDWRRLTTAPYGDCQPSFSPDGQQIAFVRPTTLGVEDLYVVPVSGGEPKRLTFLQARINGEAWTPDGREIVFASNAGGGFALWRIDASGGTPQSIGITGDFLANPSISLHGNRLAYLQETSNTNVWSLALPPAGKAPAAPVKLIYSSKEENSPQYSPDGKKIVFVSNRTGSDEIWICERDGSNPMPLTKFNGPITGTPRWSPDGQQIVFDSRAGGESRLYIVRPDGTGTPRAIPSISTEDSVPSWSRDGKWIFFASTHSGPYEIWKTPVAGGEPVQLTRQGGFAPLPSPDGKFVYYAKGAGTPGIWRVPPDGGVETRVMDDLQVSFWGQWAVADTGIYFMNAGEKQKAGIHLFRFSTSKVEHIFTPEKPPIPWTDGLAVSPDGHTILYTQVDQRTTNIMLVKNFP
jgi:Tol biopolymer transport system component/class 3 adenylate cyclase